MYVLSKHKTEYNKQIVGNTIFLLLLLPGLVVSIVPQKTFVEIVGHFYLMFIGVVLYNSFRSKEGLEHLLIIISLTGLIASSIGIWDAIASFSILPNIFPLKSAGEVVSGFRNAGQAGSFMLVILAILIPLKYSMIYYNYSKNKTTLINTSIILSIILLLLTGKLAAYIGLFVGTLIFIIVRKNKKILKPILILVTIILITSPALKSLAPSVYERIEYRIYKRVELSFEGRGFLHPNGFMVNNFNEAISSFKANPIAGTGLGGFSEVNQINHLRLEVHGTILKLLGETGVLGLIGYLIFIIIFLNLFRIKDLNQTNIYINYLLNMFPFILGCLISWMYTYHMRKREFYILLAIVSITSYLAKKYDYLFSNEVV